MNKMDRKVKVQKTKKKQKIYLGYYSRLIIMILFICILLVMGIFFIEKSVSVAKEQKISYVEKSNLDYKVYLKKNDFYESEYLGKNMSYIASIIDYIHLYFDYNFVIDRPIDADFNYKIIAVLTISDENSSNIFFNKEYTLQDKKVKTIQNGTFINIKEDIKIDYDYYNQLANSFKQTYGISTKSDLAVYLKVDRHTTSDLLQSKEFDADNSMLINIPLSQKAINIKMDYDLINNNAILIADNKLNINNILYFSVGIIFFILTIVIMIKIWKKLTLLFNRPNKYDIFIKRILREYDRLIVITQTAPNLKDFHVFKVNDFNELLDVRDNVKKPIMYYNIVDHMKCYFYLKDNDTIYLLYLKAVDMEQKDET